MSGAVHPNYTSATNKALWNRIRAEAVLLRCVMSPGEIDQCLSVIRRCKAELVARGDWKKNGVVG